MTENAETKKGCLARLSPGRRGGAILLLGGILIFGLYWLQPDAFKDGLTLELLERLLNIFIATGTIWVVLFEGEAIIAALAAAFTGRLSRFLAAVATAMRRAGVKAEVIEDTIREIAEDFDGEPLNPAQPQTGAANAQSRSTSKTANTSPDDVAPLRESDPESVQTKRKLARPLVAGAVIALVAFSAVLAFWLILRETSKEPRQVPNGSSSGGQPSEIEAPTEIWVRAHASISATLAACTGKPVGKNTEQQVAVLNGIPCSDRRGFLRCVTTEGQALRLSNEVACKEGYATYPSVEAARNAE